MMNNTTANTSNPKNISAFFVLVFIITLPLYIITALIPQEMAIFMGFTITLAPITAALILTYRENGADGARGLLKRSFDYKRITKKIWYVPIFIVMPVLFGLASGVMILMGLPIPEPLMPLVAAPVAFLMFFFLALFEEVGWMGYVFEPMQDRGNAFTASIVLGIIWAAWHLPLYIAAGFDPLWIAGQYISMLGIRTLITWSYNNAGKSVFAVVLFHAVYNVCTMFITSFYTTTGHSITSVLIIIAAVVVVFLWGAETLARYRFKKA